MGNSQSMLDGCAVRPRADESVLLQNARFASEMLLKVLLLFMVALVLGCGGSEGRCGVSGKVKLKGQDLDQGTIAFYPAGQDGQPGGAPIVNGGYQMSPQQGLLPGKYKVAISSPIGGDAPAIELPGDSNVTIKDRIPAKYNDKTELTAEVTLDGNNVFDFDLKE